MSKEKKMGKTLRKNISINKNDYEKTVDFCKKSGKSFSETVRKASLKYVEEMENKDLSDFLRENYPFASEEEEAEIAEILKLVKEE